MENKILVLDIETSGFLPYGRIVEIGIIELDVITGEKKVLFDELCNHPSLTAEVLEKDWICQNGYIKKEDILKALNLEEFKTDIQYILDSYPLGATAFNNQFDFGFMEADGFKFPKKLGCPMKLSTDLCKFPKTGKAAFYGGYKWPNVEEAYFHFFGKTDYVELHRGADDAFHEADIVFELIKMGILKY